jgi:hypothetical protein
MAAIPGSCINCENNGLQNLNNIVSFIEIVLEKYEYCKSCTNSHKETLAIRFCSAKCMLEYISKNADKMNEIEFGFNNKQIQPGRF